jgi:hypothetical protein
MRYKSLFTSTAPFWVRAIPLKHTEGSLSDINSPQDASSYR